MPDGSKLPQSFRRELKKPRIDEEAFNFDKAAVQRPRRRPMVTQEDIRISYRAQDASLIEEEQRDGRTFITINSARVIVRDDEPKGRSTAGERPTGAVRPAAERNH